MLSIFSPAVRNLQRRHIVDDSDNEPLNTLRLQRFLLPAGRPGICFQTPQVLKICKR